MTPLAQLLAALRSGSTLAWLLVHAPDGDADAAVRRAWEGERTVCPILDALCSAHSAGPLSCPRYDRGKRALIRARKRCPAAGEAHDYQPCPACCDAIRAAVAPPTWAELTRAA